MPRKGMVWMYTGQPKKGLSELQKHKVGIYCFTVIQEFKVKFIQKPNPDYGYVIDVYGKWYRHYFYFIQKLKYENPAFSVPEVEDKFARLECFANNTYNLSYMRHNEQWFQVFSGISLEECMEEIRGNQLFQPML